MAKKPKKDDPKKVEERFVTCDDLTGGVKLKAGHKVLLLLRCDTPGNVTTAPPDTTTGAPPPSTTTAPPTTTTRSSGGEPTSTTTAPPTTTTLPDSTPSTTTTRSESNDVTTTTTQSTISTTTTQPRKTKKTEFGAEHFETAKSFPLPSAAALQTFRSIAALMKAEPDRKLLIVGHTDTQAGDDYNMNLSRERAGTIKAYLINDVNPWFAFYSHVDSQKRWGTKEDQYMLGALGPPYYSGTVDGEKGPETTAAIKAFQKASTIKESGTANEPTRRALILAFMKIEGTSVPDSTTIEMFGCGFHNMVEPTGPGVDCAANRRVEVYAFPGPIRPATSEWKDAKDETWNAWRSDTEAMESSGADDEPAAASTPAGRISLVVAEIDREGAEVQLFHDDGSAATESQKVSADGSVVFDGLQPHEHYVVKVNGQEIEVVSTDDVEQASSEEQSDEASTGDESQYEDNSNDDDNAS